MKKLIMCAIAVLGACALNAASVTWGVVDLYDADGESLVGTLTLASGSYTSTGTISDWEASGNFSGFDWGTDPFATGSAWTMTANIKGADGNMYSKVFDVVLGTIDTSDDRANLAAFEGLTVDAQAALLPEGVLDISDLASAGWSAAGGGTDVPEPTSGLLLLVGGAMLALRRKRA